jgi:DNA repair ATPase RecN
VTESDERVTTDDAPPAAPGPRRRVWLVLSYAVVLIALVVAVVVGNGLHSTLDHTDQALAQRRADLRDASRHLSEAKVQLTKVVGQEQQAAQVLQTDTAALNAVTASLGQVKALVQSQGAQLAELNQCMAGVTQALNSVSAGNQAAASTSLQRVQSSCTKGTSGG